MLYPKFGVFEMFSHLNKEERKEIIELVSQKMKVDPVIIEKDWWVVKTLEALFSSPYQKHLTFKGGTSLSKAYHLIDRFSEDIDITIDKCFFKPDFDMKNFQELSRKKRDSLLKDLHAKASLFIQTTIKDHLKDTLPLNPLLKISENDPLSLEIFYESVLLSQLSYIQPRIYIEFGFRGSINPHEYSQVNSYICDILGEKVDINNQLITTLKPIKTFFEKATLLHAEFHRPLEKQTPLRLSRHYYDLYKMYQSGIIESVLNSYDILYEVVHYKNILFSSGWINYPSILENKINLYPNDTRIDILKKDYEDTKIMIFGELPDFKNLMNIILEIETKINDMIHIGR
jgi:hypothetical protein